MSAALDLQDEQRLGHALRCWALRASVQGDLIDACLKTVPGAADDLQASAARDGLIAAYGQDEIQAAIALAIGGAGC
ncbi:MAG: hypothetical protein PSV22_23940 [Pseudolabrys sp.]|nr:hypothetical protein [Pseudolabrys sp.]